MFVDRERAAPARRAAVTYGRPGGQLKERFGRRSLAGMTTRAWPLVLALPTALAVLACDAMGPAAGPNKLAAERDVQRLRDLVVLPPGVTRLSTEPTGDGGLLRQPPGKPATPNVSDSHGLWRVPSALDSVVGFVKAHQPTGSRRLMRGHRSGPGIPPTSGWRFCSQRSPPRSPRAG